MSAPMAFNRQVLALISISFLRMLGIFLILPIISLSAVTMKGSSGVLVGVALGGYGITQAAMQIPIGLLADRWHKKYTLLLTLCLFIIGSAIAGAADNIHQLIIGRLLQGAAAVSTVIIAWIIDISEEKKRPLLSALFGMSIGLAFATAIILSPLLNQWLTLSDFFFISTVLGVIALLICLPLPSPPPPPPSTTAAPTATLTLATLWQDAQFKKIVIIGAGIHFALSALFYLFPPWLVQTVAVANHWHVFTAGFILSLTLSLPMLAIRRHHSLFFRLAILLMAVGVSVLFFRSNTAIGILTLVFFFAGFTFLEAMLPALIAKNAPANQRGLRVGVLLSAEFLGIFIGGSGAGFLADCGLSSRISPAVVFCLLLTLLLAGGRKNQRN